MAEDEGTESARATLSEADARKLINYIRLISRREEHKERNPYIDVGGHLESVLLSTNHVIYGRRGSGKSALIAEAQASGLKASELLIVHLDCEQFKDHSFPKLLIEMLVALFEGLGDALPASRHIPWTKAGRAKNAIKTTLAELNTFLQIPDDLEVAVNKTTGESEEVNATLGVKSGSAPASGEGAFGAKSSKQASESRSFTTKERTIERLQVRMKDYRSVIDAALHATGKQRLFFFADDFYHINLEWQVDTIDYLHRLTKNSRAKYKVATIRFNTHLYERRETTIRGVQENIDYSTLELDYTLEDFANTHRHLVQILKGIIREAKLSQALNPEDFISSSSLKRLVWASGGVPRDFLLIFAEALNTTLQKQKTTIAVYDVYDAARSYLENTKIPDLQGDVSNEEYGRLMNAWKWLQQNVVVDPLRNVFLVDKEEATTMLDTMSTLRKLQDFRFIHVVARDTTAANRQLATHRYQAFALDLGAYSQRLKGKNIKAKAGKSEKDLSFREIDISQMDGEGRRDAIRGGIVISLSALETAIRPVPASLPGSSGAAQGTA